MKKARGVGIVGMGVALPETVRTNDWWADELTREDPFTPPPRKDLDIDPEIVRHAARFRDDPFRGARKRRVLDEDRLPSDMEALAASRALECAGIPPDEVDLLLVYSMPQDEAVPSNSGLLAQKLGLRQGITAMALDTGCASFLTQLHTASGLIQAGLHRTAVIVQSTVTSRIVLRKQPGSRVCGDAAVASVVRPVSPETGVISYAQDTHGDLHSVIRLGHHGDPQVPWYRGDLHHSALTAQNGSPEVMAAVGGKIASFCRETCSRVLDEAECGVDDVDLFVASHPTAWFGRACCDSLGIPYDRNIDTFSETGHVMAASAPLNLWTAHQRGMLRNGSRVLVYSPGAGFFRAALLYRWNLGQSAGAGP